MVTAVTVAVAAIALIGIVVIAPVALVMRGVMPASKRHARASSSMSPWPHETIEAHVASTTGASQEHDLRRDSNIA